MTKCYINTLEEVTEEFNRKGLERFARKYKRYDVFIGDGDSIDFVEKKLLLHKTLNNYEKETKQ